jgi:hypothetical protein
MSQQHTAYGVRAVLAGAYRGDIDKRTCLTHLVAVDAEGMEYRAFCRVKFDNLCDAPEYGLPTCPACQARALKT